MGYMLAIVVIATIVGLFSILTLPTLITHAGPTQSQVVWMPKGGGSATSSRPATTTDGVTYIAAAGASTTFAIDTQGVNQIDLNLRYTGSTSAAYLLYTVQFSDGAGCTQDQTRCDWFDDYGVTVNSNISNSVGSTTALYDFKPQQSSAVIGWATTTPSLPFTNLNHPYTRFRFQTIGGAAGLWVAVSKAVAN